MRGPVLLLLTLAVTIVGESCRPDQSSLDRSLRAAEEAQDDAPIARHPASTANTLPADESFEGLALPRWPKDWHLAQRGRFGGDEHPVVWFQLEAGQTPVDEAASAALDAIRAIAGRILFEDLAFTPEDECALAQIRGSRLQGAVEAAREHGATLVRATLEVKPGFGERSR